MWNNSGLVLSLARATPHTAEAALTTHRAESPLVEKQSNPLLRHDAPPLNNLTSPPPPNSRSIPEPPCIDWRFSPEIMLAGRSAGNSQGSEPAEHGSRR